MGTQFDPRVAEAFIRLVGADDEAASAAHLLLPRREGA